MWRESASQSSGVAPAYTRSRRLAAGRRAQRADAMLCLTLVEDRSGTLLAQFLGMQVDVLQNGGDLSSFNPNKLAESGPTSVASGPIPAEVGRTLAIFGPIRAMCGPGVRPKIGHGPQDFCQTRYSLLEPPALAHVLRNPA